MVVIRNDINFKYVFKAFHPTAKRRERRAYEVKVISDSGEYVFDGRLKKKHKQFLSGNVATVKDWFLNTGWWLVDKDATA